MPACIYERLDINDVHVFYVLRSFTATAWAVDEDAEPAVAGVSGINVVLNTASFYVQKVAVPLQGHKDSRAAADRIEACMQHPVHALSHLESNLWQIS